MGQAVWMAAGSVAWVAAAALGAGEELGTGSAVRDALLEPRREQPEAGADDAAPRDPLSDISFRLRGGAGYIAEADLEDDGGSVAITRLGSSLAITGRPDERSSLTFQAGAAFSFYDFSDVGTLMPGGVEPLDEASEYDLGLLYSRRFDDTWSMFAGGTVTFAAASGASWDDAVMWGGVVGATYQINERVRVGVGVGVSSRLEDDVRFIPVPVIDWQISDSWRLRTVDRTIDIRGLELAYQATEALELFVLAGWASREFRLDDDGANPGGVFREQRVPVLGGVTWTFAPQASLEVAAGVDAWSSYEVLDSDGDELVDVDADPSLVGWLGLSVRF